MPGFTDSIVIERPAEAVFDFATDPGNSTRWLPAIARIEPITEGPVRVGSRWRETRLMGKKEASAEIEVVEHEGPGEGRRPPYRHAGRSVAMGFDGVYRYTFTPEGDGTRVDLDADVKGVNLFARLTAPWVARCMKKADGDQLARLKTALEQA